jgi:predicted  nucleic acid-binding Zn-ribbon protein
MPAKPHCETRNKLSEALVELSIKLSIAASQMAELATEDPSASRKAKVEVQRLRDECDNVRVELERHRAQHGC